MARLLTLHDPGEARRYYAARLWRDDTLYTLAAGWAAEDGARPALRDPHRLLDWRGLVAEADRVAAALHAAGVRPGDRVSVWMGNRIEAIAIFLACSRNGYVFNTSLHATYTVAEVAVLLERVSCRALFAQIRHGANSQSDDIFARAAALPAMRAVFALPPAGKDVALPPGTLPYPTGESEQPAPVTDPDKITYLAFTSGTTGMPKGVMHSDNSLLANARAMVADWRHDRDTVLLSLSQMSHHIGTVALAQALVGGFELVLSDPQAGIPVIDWIEESGATYVMGVPTHAIDILAGLDQRGRERMGRVSIFYMAGAAIPRATASGLLAKGVVPQNVYGMTENGSHQYTRPDDDVATITGTCGKACAAYEIRLFRQDDRDVEVAPGEVGEIGGRGAMRMLGYFASQEATEATLNAHGWLMSGDLGRIDDDGNLHIVGRAKDMIIRGGHNIHPAGIEDLAMRHSAVGKAAAVAVPDERLGERVCLVVTAAGADVPEGEALLAHLHAAGLSRYDMPEYFACVGALPLGPTGKILKRELAVLLREGQDRGGSRALARAWRAGDGVMLDLIYRDDVAVLTLNRPEVLNALNFAQIDAIDAAFDAVAASAARALIVTGAGEKAFCAGADIKELTGRSLAAQRSGAQRGQAVFAKLDRLAIPSIALVNGFALGGGAELALACTFRLATAKARFGLPEIKLGLIPGYGGTQRLPRLIGEARALEIILTGRMVSADEALAVGLVNRLVEPPALEAAIAFAQEFTGFGRLATMFAREAVQRAAGVGLGDGLQIEADLSTLAYRTADAEEGMQAFLDKRPPMFRGS